MNSKEQLDTWTADIDVPPRFQANVWAEIAARESRWTRFLNWLTAEFYKPLPAAALVTLALVLSMSTAYIQAQDSNARADRQMEARYMETINPLAHAGGHS